MKRLHWLFYFLFGLALGAAIFWAPTVIAGGNGFALPVLFLGPWYFLAIPYLVIFALVFGALVAIYRLLKKTFPVKLRDGIWIALGLYLSLTFLFHFIGMSVGGGILTI